MWWKQKEPYAKAYLKAVKERPKGAYTVVDTEMSSLDMSKNFLLSCGVVDIENGFILAASAREWYIKQPQDAFNETAVIHSITKDRESSITITEFVREFLAHIQGKILVAHSAEVDVAILNKVLKKAAFVKLKNRVIDTQQLAIFEDHGAYPSHIEPREYSLDVLCERYEIAISERHSALGDAYATAQLFLCLKKGAFV